MKHLRAIAALTRPASVFVSAPGAMAQGVAAGQEGEIDQIVVTGIRRSLSDALEQKRLADNLVEVILAEDIGKLPDQNLAEVLENVAGVLITRTVGVGTGVQNRGTNANRSETNGLSAVASGDRRAGTDSKD